MCDQVCLLDELYKMLGWDSWRIELFIVWHTVICNRKEVQQKVEKAGIICCLGGWMFLDNNIDDWKEGCVCKNAYQHKHASHTNEDYFSYYVQCPSSGNQHQAECWEIVTDVHWE